MAISLQIKNTSDIAVDGIKMLLYGGANTGKSPLAATAPNPIVFDVERKADGLQGMAVPYVTIDSYDALIEAVKWATQSPESKNYDTLIVDSISEFAEIAVYDFKKRYEEDKGKNIKDARQAFYDAQEKTLDLVRELKRIPQKNVIVVAKMQHTQLEGGKIVYGPEASGTELPRKLPYAMNYVLCLRNYIDPVTNAVTPFLQCRKDDLYFARNVGNRLEQFEQNCDMTYIFRKIYGS